MPNAKSGRDSLEITIYGMVNVPPELIEEKYNEKMGIKKKKGESGAPTPVSQHPIDMTALTINANYQGASNPMMNLSGVQFAGMETRPYMQQISAPMSMPMPMPPPTVILQVAAPAPMPILMPEQLIKADVPQMSTVPIGMYVPPVNELVPPPPPPPPVPAPVLVPVLPAPESSTSSNTVVLVYTEKISIVSLHTWTKRG